VVVVTYDSGDSLETFLSSLGPASARPVQVVVTDNASTDGAPEVAAAAHDNVTVLQTGANLGYGRAANRGVAATDTEWVVVANPDIVWSPGALDELVEAAGRWPRAGSIGPLIRTPEGSVYPSARALPALGAGIGHALVGWWWPSNPWSAAYRQDRGEPTERTAGWLSGSCVLLRREAFESVGGFDDGYFMYFEDVDLGDRLARKGWLNVYVPSAEVLHVGAHSTAQHPEKMTEEHHRSAMRYLAARYPGRRWFWLRWVLSVGLRVRARLARNMKAITGGAHYQRNEKG
jgi:N-acetylglucosaminyl-diphospho-decaprenol L-rhamnosyltransferase